MIRREGLIHPILHSSWYNSSYSSYCPAIHPILQIVLVQMKIASARNWINSAPKAAAMTFFFFPSSFPSSMVQGEDFRPITGDVTLRFETSNQSQGIKHWNFHNELVSIIISKIQSRVWQIFFKQGSATICSSQKESTFSGGYWLVGNKECNY